MVIADPTIFESKIAITSKAIHENIRRKPTALAVGGRRGLYFQYILNFSFNISTLDLER